MSISPQLPAKLANLNTHEIENLKRLTTLWSGLNGLLVMRPTGIQVAPCSLLPMPFPRRVYQQVKELMLDFNELVHSVSLDYDFLYEQLSPLNDEFQDRLLKILKHVNDEGVRQKLSLGVHRSDYMLHAAPGERLVARQVEINTIASSFAGLSEKVSQLHRFLLKRAPIASMSADDCPENLPIETIAGGIAEASRMYAASETTPPSSSPRQIGILFVVQPSEGNIYDQGELESRLWSKHSLPVVRATLEQVNSLGTLDEATRHFTISGLEISVVYFRAGYAPTDYPSEAEWNARLALERSAAIKCPTVAYQCVGAKKIQQVLARPGLLERFAASPEAAARMRGVFAGLYPLGDGSAEAEAAKRAAQADPSGYVLKPQREGGGNNFYEEEMKRMLDTQTDEQLRAYILMDIIRAPAARALFLRAGEAVDTQATTELGTYGVTLAEAGAQGGGVCARMVLSKVAGTLLRSKAAASKETGVAAGFGVLDSPLLYDD